MSVENWQSDLLREIAPSQSQPQPQPQPQPGQQPPAVPERPGPQGEPMPAPAPVAPQQYPSPPRARPGTMQSPQPTPESVPTLDPRIAYAQGAPLHGESLTSRAGRALARAVGSSAVEESRQAAALAAAMQQPVATGRQVAVTSIRGGAGKSTVAALLGLAFAHYRTDPVLTVEADPALGTLPIRLGAQTVRWTVPDLARIIDPSMQLTDVIGYLVQYAGGGWLLPGSQGLVGTSLDLASYKTVMTALRRYFGVTVVDCETLPAEVARTALTASQARALVVPATVEGLASTRSVLAWMGSLPRPLLEGTVIVLTQASPDATLDIGKAMEYLQVGGAEVVFLPYDRHLAAGGTVRMEMIARSSHQAATQVAAALLNRAVRTA